MGDGHVDDVGRRIGLGIQGAQLVDDHPIVVRFIDRVSMLVESGRRASWGRSGRRGWRDRRDVSLVRSRGWAARASGCASLRRARRSGREHDQREGRRREDPRLLCHPESLPAPREVPEKDLLSIASFCADGVTLHSTQFLPLLAASQQRHLSCGVQADKKIAEQALFRRSTV